MAKGGMDYFSCRELIKSIVSFFSRLIKNNKNKTIPNQSHLVCCKLFISEGHNREALDAIEQAARLDPETAFINKFEDEAYNRTRYTLVSYVVHDSTGTPIYSPLKQTVVAMVEAAYGAINLELHTGGHPRLGVIDDILFHPLALASMDEAAWLAKAVAANIGSTFQVPVYLYAAAHPTGKALETFRRELGYYTPNFMDKQWAGLAVSKILPEMPNDGPAQVSPARGVVMVGARPWIGLYNVPLMSKDVSIARRIARKVSARGGGLPTVQALGLFHGEDSTEVACMLLDTKQVGADKVQDRVEMLAAQEGLDVGKGYFTDLSEEMILEKYMNLISAKAN
ncbi:formimidoyltransferase-cyclodeaminase-like [Melia azedarach]|uniref:Formimidoyltransferase-cyclodeaminase-like n=1 Tax=Melia azedarach TaxID=155640 RepID=A0ACC1Z1G1_MELAZ|nr:formimidoyltransferase-cyclodeaminase-like [Melia azedarach]